MTIDLGGKTLSTTAAGERHDYAIDVYGTVTLTNGTIDARGVQVRPGGKLIIGDGVTVNAVDKNGGAAIWIYEGGELVIEGGKFVAVNAGNDSASGAAALINDGGTVTIKGGTFVSNSGAYAIQNNKGTMTIDDANVTGVRGALYAPGGTIIVNGGTYNVTVGNDVGWVAMAHEAGKIVINGGQFSTVVNERMFNEGVEDKR